METVWLFVANFDKIGTKNCANLKQGLLYAAKIGRNWNWVAKLGLCILGKPYKIPGAEPEVYNLLYTSVVKDPNLFLKFRN